MAMLDALFNKGAFKGAKCKTLLKLTIPRIKLLRNRREIQLKQMRRDIAKLLENGQEATARIRVEHIIREENMMAAQEIIELFCELITVRLPIIETQRECPLDLKEAISSICFAAPRCSDLPELQQVQMLFAAKYGKEFVAAATELIPDCGVNRQIIELLSVRAPPVETKLKLLQEIAAEHELDWDPTASESEFLKPYEDLLHGPTTLPLPKEKHDESLSSANPAEESQEDQNLDVGSDSFDLPEVPRVSVRTASDIPSAPEYFPSPAASPALDMTHDLAKESAQNEDMFHVPSDTVVVKDNKQQFIPFVSPPTIPSSFSEQRSDPRGPLSSASIPVKQNQQAPSLSQTKSEANIDLQDVLAAAQTAAETAEHAAAAARTAASLAQVRITELITKRNNKTPESNESKNEHVHSDQPEPLENPTSDHEKTSADVNHVASFGSQWRSNSMEQSPEPQPAHLYQRSPSLEDDPYSYPNLFTSQASNLKSEEKSHPDGDFGVQC